MSENREKFPKAEVDLFCPTNQRLQRLLPYKTNKKTTKYSCFQSYNQWLFGIFALKVIKIVAG